MSAELPVHNDVKLSDVYKTTNPSQAVKLRFLKDGIGSEEPVSIIKLLKHTANNYPDHAALKYKTLKTEYTTVTYKQYEAKVHHVAKAFIKLGLERYHSVGVLAFNCAEWFYSAQAAIHAGGIVAGIYTTNSAEAVLHVLKDSRSNIIVVDDSKQMEKIHQLRNKLPFLKAAIQIHEPYMPFMNKEIGYYRVVGNADCSTPFTRIYRQENLKAGEFSEAGMSADYLYCIEIGHLCKK